MAGVFIKPIEGVVLSGVRFGGSVALCHPIMRRRVAAQGLADRTTPFLENCWYVAGFADDFGEGLNARGL